MGSVVANTTIDHERSTQFVRGAAPQ